MNYVLKIFAQKIRNVEAFREMMRICHKNGAWRSLDFSTVECAAYDKDGSMI